MSSALKGLGVLVTRPAHQADTLCQMIEDQGGTAIRCPTLEIGEPHDNTSAKTILQRLDHYHLAIFTSVNAVERALPLIPAHTDLLTDLDIAAVGKATARALEKHDITCHLRPEQDFSSEGLLALPRLQQVRHNNIAIICGEGGRTLLTRTLTVRGAHVDCAEVYRRICPEIDAAALLKRWKQGEISATVITSTESLQNLFDMLGVDGHDYLRDTPLILSSHRIQQIATHRGCRHLLLARDASDEAITAALLDLATNFSPIAR